MNFDRFIKLIGKENFEKVKNLKILIVGVGGVGGYVVESLARCGVETIIIVDPDRIDRTNINRQIIATETTIGRKKVEAWEERIKEISKTCQCIPIAEKINEDTIHLLKEHKPDFVVDACDDINAKKLLIKECIKENIKLISSMGTGKRLDPSKLEITILNKTSYDPIAKEIRKYLNKEKIKGKLPVISSTEQPVKTEKIGSNAFVPATAGLLAASYVINELIKEN